MKTMEPSFSYVRRKSIFKHRLEDMHTATLATSAALFTYILQYCKGKLNFRKLNQITRFPRKRN